VDELDRKMRGVLTQLELTSNGRTATYNSSGGGEEQPIPRLNSHDAPHLHFAELYARANDLIERERVIERAAAALKEARRRAEPPPAGSWESAEQRDARILEKAGGDWEAIEVAVWARCGLRAVTQVWEANDFDGSNGRPLQPRATSSNGSSPPRPGPTLQPRGGMDEQACRAEVQRLAAEGRPARQIAMLVGISSSTVRRYLGRKR